jgi:hypothetical protein
MEATRTEKERRYVQRPAILIGVTGRLVVYPEKMFNEAQIELDNILRTASRINLTTELPFDEVEKCQFDENSPCSVCS